MLTGAIVGAVGSFINRGLSIFEIRQQAKIDEKRRSDEIELGKLGASKEAIVASFKHDADIGANASTWVNNIRALVRPSITAYALIIVTIFFFFADAADKTLLIASVVDIATMAVTWWFADRFKK